MGKDMTPNALPQYEFVAQYFSLFTEFNQNRKYYIIYMQINI